MIPQRSIGDVRVSAVGLGCMPLSNGRMVDQREQAVGTIHAALDAGITLLDTANIYAPSWDAVGHNEALVAEAIRTDLEAAAVLGIRRILVRTGKGRATEADLPAALQPVTVYDDLARAVDALLAEAES